MDTTRSTAPTGPANIDYEFQIQPHPRVPAGADAEDSSAPDQHILLRFAHQLARPFRWFAKNHQTMSSLIVVVGLPATIFSLWLTRVQMTTAQDNFKEEMSVQRKATAAILVNDFLKNIHTIESDPEFESNPDSKATLKKLSHIGAQAQFMIQGLGDPEMRSRVLSHVATRSYAAKLIEFNPTSIMTNIDLNNQKYSGEIEGTLAKRDISHASFEGVLFDNVDFKRTHFLYTDLTDARFLGDRFFNDENTSEQFFESKLNCVSLNGAMFQGKHLFEGANINYVDFRNVSVSGAGNNEIAVANLIMSAESFDNILVDRDVRVEMLSNSSLNDKLSGTTFAPPTTDTAPVWMSSIQAQEFCK